MIYTIKNILNNINARFGNSLVKKRIEILNLDQGDSPIRVNEGTLFCIGIRDISDCDGEDSIITFHDVNGVDLGLDSDDYELDKNLGNIYMKGSFGNIAKIVCQLQYYNSNCHSMTIAWNNAVAQINSMFFNGRTIKIEAPSSFSGTYVDIIDMDDPEFSSLTQITAIYQNEAERESYPFEQRDNRIFISPKTREPEPWYDYGNTYETEPIVRLIYPFYVRGSLAIPRVQDMSDTETSQEISLSRKILNQLELLTAYYALERMFYNVLNYDASNGSFFKQSTLSKQMFSINNELFSDLMKKNIPTAVKKESASRPRDYYNTFE